MGRMSLVQGTCGSTPGSGGREFWGVLGYLKCVRFRY